MIITKVQYGKTYSLGNYCSERIDLEASIDESSESVTDAVFQLREYCDQLHKTNNPHLYQEQDTTKGVNHYTQPHDGITQDQTIPSQHIENQSLTQEQKIHNLITQSTTIKQLEEWKLIANNKQYPTLKEIYDKKYEALSNQTTPNKV